MKDRLLIWLLPRLIKLIYLFLVSSIRWQTAGKPYDQDDPQRNLYAFWHARMLMIPRLSRGIWHGYMLISSHRDGGFIADTMHLLGIETVRGSSTRGGARALLKMLRAVKDDNRHLAITPDGPKGPREKVQKGTVQLALKAELPIIPVCYATKRHWRINSWDHFYIPQPFTRGVFVFGEAVIVSSDEDMDQAIARTQKSMDNAQQRADNYFE
ncbi:MAG: lysophospholipid acyltransferase family protein [Mariprofundaceae bacterium]|nr:lysophospholipid acyltransferase family protein [Mariprofundaceae bacterium]MDQ6996661.1 lysophospholipid acyltransferase family protein [Mariprofundus sp.]